MDNINPQAITNTEAIHSIRVRFLDGDISYIEAQELAKPIIEAMNVKNKELAKKYGVRPKKLYFSSMMR